MSLADARRRTARTGRAQQHRRETPEQLDEVFFALSHSARRLLLERLAEGGEPSVAKLAEPLAESPAQITKHLAILERAGLISRQIAGREHRLALVPRGMSRAVDWVARHRELWAHSLDNLEKFLDSEHADAAATTDAARASRRGKAR